MDKQTKLLLGLGLVAIGGYLWWKQNRDAKGRETPAASFTGNAGPRKLLQMAGGGQVGDRKLLQMAGGGEVGNRQLLQMVGGGEVGKRQLLQYAGNVGRRQRGMAGGQVWAKGSKFNAGGAFPAGHGFFDVEDSGWQGFAGDKFFDVADSGWQR